MNDHELDVLEQLAEESRDSLSLCDCCGERAGTHKVYYPIETWACDECSDPWPKPITVRPVTVKPVAPWGSK
jgi:hypothetical protein